MMELVYFRQVKILDYFVIDDFLGHFREIYFLGNDRVTQLIDALRGYR